MPKIFPFKATLPSRDKVTLVNSRAYEDYSVAELASQLDYNPYSFLHIVNPFYTNQQKVDNEKRLKQVNSNYNRFKKNQILIKEENQALYLHKIVSQAGSFIGIIAGLSIEEYKQNLIKKHEDTFDYRVELFKDYMKYAGFYTEPVLITYPDSKSLNKWIEEFSLKQPYFEFATTNKEIHYFWKIESEEDILKIQAEFNLIDCFYIADGHHRTESATRLYNETQKSPYFMSYLIAESNLKISEFNRVIRDLNGYSKTEFLKLLDKYFIVKNKKQTIYTPTEKFLFGMYLDGEFYKLKLKENQVNESDTLQSLDTQILYDFILKPILGIEDLRTDQRIEYLAGKQSITQIKNKVDSQDFEVAFLLYKTDISEIKKVADQGLIMPPKSTYIDPKFRVGVTIFEVEI